MPEPGPTTTDPELQPDCARCAALCCVAFAFDRSEDFALDKPAGKPCPNLTADDRCRLHADLVGHGFAGCASYDCHGAGQRVTQEMFAGRSWRDDPALAAAMFEAFRVLRKVHALLDLLRTAGRLPLTPEQNARREQLRAALLPEEGWTPATLAAFECGTLEEDVRSYLTALRDNAVIADRRVD